MADESKIVEAEEAAGVDSALPAAVEAETSGAGALTVQPDVPASAVQDVQKIMEQAGGANGYAVLLSLIAVAGGGAGWKFYQSFAKQRHEQKMKQLEIEQSKAEKQDDSHKQCDAKNAALAVQIDALSSKLTELQEQVSPQQGGAELGVGFSGEDLENLDKRLKALENWKKRGAKK